MELEAEIKDIAEIRASLLFLLKHQQKLRELVKKGLEANRLDPNIPDVQMALNGVDTMNLYVKEKTKELDRMEECIMQCLNQKKWCTASTQS